MQNLRSSFYYMRPCMHVLLYFQLGARKGKGLGAQKLSKNFSEIEQQIEQQQKEKGFDRYALYCVLHRTRVHVYTHVFRGRLIL